MIKYLIAAYFNTNMLLVLLSKLCECATVRFADWEIPNERSKIFRAHCAIIGALDTCALILMPVGFFRLYNQVQLGLGP